MIRLINVSIKYIHDFYSLYNINLEIDKNTLLLGDEMSGNIFVNRLIAGIDKNFLGEILIENKNILDLKNSEFNLAYIPENVYLFNSTIEKNLAYPLKIRRKILKINKNDIKNMINSLILRYNLENFPKKIKKMNLSQKKIIALARAIIREPKYILIDNFFNKLDNEYISTALTMLKDSNAIIIASDNENKTFYKDFNTIEFDSGSIKK